MRHLVIINTQTDTCAISSSSPCSLVGWGPSHLIASSTFIVNVLHLPLSSAVVFHSWSFIPACFTQSFHRSFGLPLLLLPPSSAFRALFDSLSSPILCTCPAHLILLPATCRLDAPSSDYKCAEADVCAI